MRHSIRIAVSLALVSALACEKKSKDKKDDEPAAKPTSEKPADPPTTAGATSAQSTPQAPPVVTLVSPGGQPRKELRLRPKAGDKQQMIMLMKTAMEMQVAGMANPPMKLPAMKMTMDMTVDSVTPEGDIHYKFVLSGTEVVEEPGVMPQVVSAMKTALASAKGMTGSGVLSNRGFNKGTKIDIPAGADPQVRQILEGMKDSFNQIAAPLPAEPVGPGAKWDVKMTLVQQGMTLDQVASYELLSMEGDLVKAKSTVTQSAANQKIQNPQMPNLKMDLIRLKADGTGEVTFDMGKIVPPSATGDIHSEASMSMDMGGQKQNMSMKMDINLQVTGK